MANGDILSTKWKSMRPLLKEHWHALTDDDFKLIDGSKEVLVSVLCERYPYSEEKARMEVDQFLDQVQAA